VKSIRKHIIFPALTVFLVIICLEIALNLLGLMSSRVNYLLASPWAAPAVPDEQLGFRPNPAFPGHDSKGFRNPGVPASADVIAMGDSQTYGTGVEPDEAWPRQLEPMIGKTVYSMAFGGCGPVNSLILWDEAIAFDPKIIIEAFYSGNDLVDVFNTVYNMDQFVELESPEPQVQSLVRKMEGSEPIREHASRILNMGVTHKTSTKSASSPAFFPTAFLSQHSRIYGLLRRIKYEISQIPANTQDPWEKAKTHAKNHSAYTQIFNNGPFRTVFTSEYRLLALDLKDPRVVEGYRIALRAIQRMKERAEDKNIRFIVLLIPTKELVFKEL
jgi:hypothetical protein